jgi:hypothetical protein
VSEWITKLRKECHQGKQRAETSLVFSVLLSEWLGSDDEKMTHDFPEKQETVEKIFKECFTEVKKVDEEVESKSMCVLCCVFSLFFLTFFCFSSCSHLRSVCLSSPSSSPLLSFPSLLLLLLEKFDFAPLRSLFTNRSQLHFNMSAVSSTEVSKENVCVCVSVCLSVCLSVAVWLALC